MLSICPCHKFRVSYLYSPAHLFSSTHKTMRKYRKLERNMKISFKKSVPENKEKHQSMFAWAQSDKSDCSLSFPHSWFSRGLEESWKTREEEGRRERKKINKRRKAKRKEQKRNPEQKVASVCHETQRRSCRNCGLLNDFFSNILKLPGLHPTQFQCSFSPDFLQSESNETSKQTVRRIAKKVSVSLGHSLTLPLS